MKKELKISLLQEDLQWESPTQNRANFSKKIDDLGATDLILLPEMFTTGFSQNVKGFAEAHPGDTLQWMQEIAAKKQAAVVGSVMVSEKEEQPQKKYYNRLYFVFPNGDFQQYDKRHLFTYADEHKTYTPGSEKLTVEYLGWKICPLVCYDLRFPVWARNVEEYDLLLFLANWPQKRIQSWDILLRARAVENLAFVAGLNRVGVDGNALTYNGHSGIYDPLGNPMVTSDTEKAFAETVLLRKLDLEALRKDFSFLQDKDTFYIEK